MENTRVCTICKLDKHIDEFPSQGGVNKSYKRHQCLRCFVDLINNQRREKRQWVLDIKKTLKCAHCGNDDHRALEFHHRDPSEKEIAIAAIGNWSHSKIQKELEKCDVLCVNCHRIVHMDEVLIRRATARSPSSENENMLVTVTTNQNVRKCKDCGAIKLLDDFNISKVVEGKVYYRHDCKKCKIDKAKALIKSKQTWFANYKKTLSCIACGNKDSRVLEFHHEDASTKEIAVAEAINSSWSIERIQSEIAKCQVLCGNCHRIHHHEERVAAKKKVSKSPCAVEKHPI